MIDFEINDNVTGKAKFIAKINCSQDESLPIKLRLAIEWGIINSVDLSYTNLCFADLRHINLNNINLCFADLRYADLSHANLSYANLDYADLRHAILHNTNLLHVNLLHVDLRHTYLRYIRNGIIPVHIDRVGDELRIGYAIWDENKNDVMVYLGHGLDDERTIINSVIDKYGEDSGYAMMVRAACKVARERKVLNPTEEEKDD